MFLQQLRKRLKEENYHIYTEGQKFEYDNAKRVVESNGILVAIKYIYKLRKRCFRWI